MNYKESKNILAEIKKAKRILLSCHWSPDPDSIASNLALYQVLKGFTKKVRLISPNKVYSNVEFLPNLNKIEAINNKNFDYSAYDLFIVLDSSSIDRVIGLKNVKVPDTPIITIDHHASNDGYGFLNILDITSSTCEILYRLFQDWRVQVDKGLATCLLAGIYADSVSFQTANTEPSTFKIASELVDSGADIKTIILNLYHSNDFDLMKFWGVLLEKMEIDNEHRFVWTAVPYSVFKKYGEPAEAKSLAASLLFRTVKDTDFGMVMIEQRPGILNISFRARTDFDVSRIAEKLGGAGHKGASGAWFEFENFNGAVEKVLKVARKHAKKK